MFKIVNGYEDVDRNMFFKLKEGSRTRGHKAALVKERCRLDMRKYYFSQRNLLFGMAIFLNLVKSNVIWAVHLKEVLKPCATTMKNITPVVYPEFVLKNERC